MLQKILFKPGINRENTRYTTEGGWYDGDKIRFRQGTPEVIGGWERISSGTYSGICRSLWTWETLAGITYTGVGTNTKFYVVDQGTYYDITPIRITTTLANPFTATSGSNVVSVYAPGHGATNQSYVTFSGAVSLGGNVTAAVLNQEYQITYIDADHYNITVAVTANGSDTGHGGATVTAAYQVNAGPATSQPFTGWGASGWGLGGWGVGLSDINPMRIWSQTNWGQNLVFAPTRGTIYYWDTTTSTSARGVAINTGLGGTFTATNSTITTVPTVLTFSSLVLGEGSRITVSGASLPAGLVAGTYYVRNPNGNTCNVSASATGALISTTSTGSGSISNLPDVPVATNFIFVSDTYRFLMAFGCNPLTDNSQDRMLIRWANQESLTDWYPDPNVNQAGELRLSHGSQIVTAVQTRQEIFTITDSSAYSLQYLGPPYNWGAQLLADNISIAGPNAAIIASGVVYWMGVDKFYRYDGRVQTLRCDLRQYIFSDFNADQAEQVFAGTVEGFNEVWWFYCTAGTTESPNTTIDRYVVYNYAEDIWYYGSMGRTAWLDSGLSQYPIAATYLNNIVNQEYGLNDNATGTAVPLEPFITSSEFDIGDGHNFGFVWRILPDITFRQSTAEAPAVTMTLYPLENSGSGYLVPASEGGTNFASVAKQTTVNVEKFTGQVYVRVRGRQMAFKVNSSQLNTTWQLGAPRIDIKQDGRR